MKTAVKYSRWDVALYWASSPDRARFAPHLMDLGEPCCFGCGWYSERWDNKTTSSGRWNSAALERAHVVPDSMGGPAEPENLILLCKPCHVASPDWPDPLEMVTWLAARKSRPSAEMEDVMAWQAAADSVPELATLQHLPEERVHGLIWEALQLAGRHWGAGMSHGTRVSVLRHAVRLSEPA